MLVGFVSPLRGKGSCTSTTVLTALRLSVKYKSNNCIFKAGGDHKQIERPFYSKFNSEYFLKENTGISILEEAIRTKFVNGEIVKGSVRPLIDKRLSVLSGASRMIETEVTKVYSTLGIELKKQFDNTFVDLGDLSTGQSQAILPTCDIVVILLPQDEDVRSIFVETKWLDDLYQKVSGSVIYCFSKLHIGSTITVSKMKKHYKIRSKDTSYLPFSIDFFDRYNSNELVEFIMKVPEERKLFEFQEDNSVLLVRNVDKLISLILRKMNKTLGESDNVNIR